jgi:hypothetical protein
MGGGKENECGNDRLRYAADTAGGVPSLRVVHAGSEVRSGNREGNSVVLLFLLFLDLVCHIKKTTKKEISKGVAIHQKDILKIWF